MHTWKSQNKELIVLTSTKLKKKKQQLFLCDKNHLYLLRWLVIPQQEKKPQSQWHKTIKDYFLPSPDVLFQIGSGLYTHVVTIVTSLWVPWLKA